MAGGGARHFGECVLGHRADSGLGSCDNLHGPDLLLRQLSLMASSRVLSLVVTLSLVITVGLYLLSLSLLSDVLILASATLLARLDLSHIKVVPPPQLLAFWLVIVVSGIWLGHGLPNPAVPPCSDCRLTSAGDKPRDCRALSWCRDVSPGRECALPKFRVRSSSALTHDPAAPGPAL